MPTPGHGAPRGGPAASPPAADHGISLREAFRVWVKVGLNSFGGPAGQIAVMHRILVQERRWIGESRFLHALSYCMLLPGPEAMQLATYVGWLLHRTLGGLVAGILFVLPGFVTILALSILYAGFQDLTPVQALFYGLKPAVLAVVVEAVVRIGRRALRNRTMIGLAAAAFVAIFFGTVPFPLIVAGAALVGYLGGRRWPRTFLLAAPAGAAGARDEAVVDRMFAAGIPDHVRPSAARTARVAAVWLVLWLGPVTGLVAVLGPRQVFSQIATFFSTAAVVTFGGAYAVLAYMAQQAVERYGWLAPGEMLDGLGMAETTPGPLIQVVQFVGFMGAFRDPGPLDPMLAGVLAAVLTTWVTFVPCFLWIFVGAPYVEALRGHRGLGTALGGVTAAVVGVVLNLAVWFALHTLFADVVEVRVAALRLLVPVWPTLDVGSLVLATGAAVAIFRFHAGMIPTLAGSALAGAAWYLLTRA
jgi:chromate transporter